MAAKKKMTPNKAASTTRGHMNSYLKRLEKKFINDPNTSEEFKAGARRAILMAKVWMGLTWTNAPLTRRVA